LPVAENLAMPRRYRDQTFRKTGVVRALKAAQAAGIPNPRIEIDRHGTIAIVTTEPLKDDGAANPWDEVLTDDADEKRSP
jgi:hypothetical protein